MSLRFNVPECPLCKALYDDANRGRSGDQTPILTGECEQCVAVGGFVRNILDDVTAMTDDQKRAVVAQNPVADIIRPLTKRKLSYEPASPTTPADKILRHASTPAGPPKKGRISPPALDVDEDDDELPERAWVPTLNDLHDLHPAAIPIPGFAAFDQDEGDMEPALALSPPAAIPTPDFERSLTPTQPLSY